MISCVKTVLLSAARPLLWANRMLYACQGKQKYMVVFKKGTNIYFETINKFIKMPQK